MKKFVVTILAFLYLSSTVGVTVHFHYCMDELVNWELWHSNDKKCGKCGMEKSQEKDTGCCKDEHKLVKLESDHKGSTICQLTELAPVALSAPLFVLPQNNLPIVAEQKPLIYAPSRDGGIVVYIRNCVFCI